MHSKVYTTLVTPSQMGAGIIKHTRQLRLEKGRGWLSYPHRGLLRQSRFPLLLPCLLLDSRDWEERGTPQLIYCPSQ